MGLDMYLEKRHYVQQWDHIKPEMQFTVTVKRGGKPYEPIKQNRITYVIEQVGYWRKANAIHKWFVDHVQHGNDDCGQYYVSAEQLQLLLTDVSAALEAKDPSKLLPTQSGFFFGPTEYGEYYRQDLTETKKLLEGILAEDLDSADFYYHSSW